MAIRGGFMLGLPALVALLGVLQALACMLLAMALISECGPLPPVALFLAAIAFLVVGVVSRREIAMTAGATLMALGFLPVALSDVMPTSLAGFFVVTGALAAATAWAACRPDANGTARGHPRTVP